MTYTRRPDTDAALYALGGGDLLQGRPAVLCVRQRADSGLQQTTVGSRFELIWAADDAGACKLLKERSASLAAIVMDVELPDSRLDGVQLARLLRGTLDPDRVAALPEYARTVPVCPRMPIVFVSRDLERDAEAVRSVGGATRVYADPVDPETLLRDLEGLSMKTAVSASSRLLETTASAAMSAKELLRLIEREPGLSERLERLVEHGPVCPAPGGASCRSSLDGLDAGQLRLLLCCTATFDLLPAGPGLDTVLANVLRRGAAASLIGERLGLSSHRCFTVGLLLDCALMARAHQNPGGAIEVADTPALARTVREQAAGVVPHYAASAHIARAWAIDEEIAAAVEHHHNDAMPANQIGRVAWVAERFAAVYEAGDPVYHRQLSSDLGRRAGLSDSEISELLAQLPSKTAAAAGAFDRPLPGGLAEGAASGESALGDLHSNYRRLVRLLASVTHEKDTLNARLRAANGRLAEYAATDALTRLANRRAFEMTLQRQLGVALRAELPLSLIIADIDGFHLVNDSHGEQMGDEVLCTVADLVRRSIRSGDFCARAGGEEFAIILLGSGKDAATRVAERIRSRIDASRVASRAQGDAVRVTASFGVAVVDPPLNVTNAEQLVRRAGDAVSAAKDAGRNCVRVG